MEVEKLKKMYNHLLTVRDEDFYIRVYRLSENDKTTPVCNSVGCVIGHCTAIDATNVMKNYMKPSGEISFFQWSLEFLQISAHDSVWEFMFGSDWSEVGDFMDIEKRPKSKQDALTRIKFVIEGYYTPKFRFYWENLENRYFFQVSKLKYPNCSILTPYENE